MPKMNGVTISIDSEPPKISARHSVASVKPSTAARNTGSSHDLDSHHLPAVKIRPSPPCFSTAKSTNKVQVIIQPGEFIVTRCSDLAPFVHFSESLGHFFSWDLVNVGCFLDKTLYLLVASFPLSIFTVDSLSLPSSGNTVTNHRFKVTLRDQPPWYAGTSVPGFFGSVKTLIVIDWVTTWKRKRVTWVGSNLHFA